MENHSMNEKKGKTKISRLQGTVHMLILVAISLSIGMAGFHWIAALGWTDSFLNASMLLTGMGPVDEPESDARKIFAGVYALYSGIVFLSSIAIFIYPFIEHTGKHMVSELNAEKPDDCE